MSLAAALIYWVIVTLWTVVLATVFVAYLRDPKTYGATRLLLAVVGIDTLRNLAENVYFGLFFGSQYGLFSKEIAAVLGNPYLLIIPKVLNVIAAVAVLGVLLLRWLPMVARERAKVADTIREKSVALEQEIEEQRRLFESSLDLILVTDRHGAFLRISKNVCDMLGYKPEEMLGQNATKFIYPADLETARDQMRRAHRGESIRDFEARYVHKNGNVVRLFWSGVWSEEVQRHFFIGRDMTDRLKLEEELHQSQKMEAIGQLTGGIAHDYNNLLTVILGNSELLIEALKDKPELQSLAQLSLEAADRSTVLTQRLLAFGRRQALEPEVTDVNRLLTDMTALLRMTLGANVTKELRQSTDLWNAKIDRNQLETAIVNLCVNARDAMPQGGKLMIETKNTVLDEDYAKLRPGVMPGDYIEIAVSDTGSGMTKEVMERVFEPFFTTKDVGKGTGLGLSMIYGFVKQSGGHVAIYSEVGMGTVVRLYLPRAIEASIAPSLPEVERGALPTGNEFILLVEDDKLVRAHTLMQLQALGYRVLAAGNAKEALEHINGGLMPDLLLTDIIMPGKISGWQLADEIHKDHPDLKVVFMSGYTPETIAVQHRLEKGAAFIGKPFRRAELAEKIRDTLEGKTRVTEREVVRAVIQ